MESLFFRRLGAQLGAALDGARVEKVYLPIRQGYLFTLTTVAGKRYLHFYHGRGGGTLFLSPCKADAPKQPDAWAMWLRKRLSGVRLRCLPWDWSGRRALFGVEGREGGRLVLDMRHGPLLEPAPAPALVQEPVTAWPGLQRILSDSDVWREYPHLSPLLRQTLAHLPEEEAEELLRCAREDMLDRAHVYGREGGPARVTLWPLPTALAAGLELRTFDSVAEAARFAGEPFFHKALAGNFGAPEQEAAREAGRVNRILHRLEQEAVRLREEVGPLLERAEALKARLHHFAPGEKRETVVVGEEVGAKRVLPLDPSRSVVENMERWFHRAARGKRGLAALARRRDEVAGRGEGPARKGKAATGRRAADHRSSGLLQGIGRFLSSDGFVLLRGKNSAANHRLLTRVASPFDLWFHALDSPGAHCLLKRDHPGLDVPEKSLHEAAVLAGLKSQLAPAGKGDIVCALAGDVRTIKGAAMGQVRVDKIFCTLRVELDPEVETGLMALDQREGARGGAKHK